MSLSVSIRFCWLILAILGACTYANTFSVNYLAGSEHPQLVNADTVIKTSPSALHIADLYARLSGISPILLEDRENVASIDPLSPRTKKPILLEVHDKETLPSSVHPIVHSTSTGPSLYSVLTELKAHGIEAEGKTYENIDISSHEWINQHAMKQPVIILHHKLDVNIIKSKSSNRRLKNSARTNKKLQETDDTDDEDSIATLTEFEISQYQICLWTAVGFILLVGVSVCSIAQMEVIPDSLLYAKFQTARAGGRTD